MFSHEFLRRATLAINATRPSERVYLDADGNLLERRAATDFSPSPSGAAYSILGYRTCPSLSSRPASASNITASRTDA